MTSRGAIQGKQAHVEASVEERRREEFRAETGRSNSEQAGATLAFKSTTNSKT